MLSEKKYTWYKIAGTIREINFSPEGLVHLEVANKDICIAIHDNNLHACTQKCPHAGGDLSQGWLDAIGNIVCPLHRYKYDLKNGRNISGEGYYLKTYPIETRKDGIYIGIESLFLC